MSFPYACAETPPWPSSVPLNTHAWEALARPNAKALPGRKARNTQDKERVHTPHRPRRYIKRGNLPRLGQDTSSIPCGESVLGLDRSSAEAEQAGGGAGFSFSHFQGSNKARPLRRCCVGRRNAFPCFFIFPPFDTARKSEWDRSLTTVLVEKGE